MLAGKENMSVLSKKEVEEAKAQLTFDAFVAHFVSMHVGRPMPLWLCTTDEAKAGAMAVAQAEFEKWRKTELDKLELREAGDPLRRLRPMIVVDNG